MPIVGVRLGLTLQIGERDYFRPEISVEGVDTSLPFEPQLAAVKGVLPTLFDEASTMLLNKVEEYLKGKKG